MAVASGWSRRRNRRDFFLLEAMNFSRHIYRDDADYPRRFRVTDSPRLIGEAMRCHGPSKASSSQASSQSTTAGDTSPVSGNSSPINQGTTQLVAGGSITADPLITKQAFDAVTSLVNQALQASANTQQAVVDANGQNQNALNSVLGSVLSRDQSIASNTATGGASGQQSFILWMVGILAAAAVAVFTFGRKRKA